MIKFFRKIRFELMEKTPPAGRAGKTGKPTRTAQTGRYLKYAIGEIVLVVIGILIALQINNMNEDKKARAYEKKMLIEMKKVLVKDVYFFNNHLIGNRLQRIQRASHFFENYLLTDSINKDSINYYYSGLSTGLQVTYNKGPFEALKSTGIDKIVNDSLRNMIVDLYEFKLPRAAGLIKIYMNKYLENSEKYEDLLRDDIEINIKDNKVSYYYNKMKEVDLKTNQTFLTLLAWGSVTSGEVIGIFNSITPEMENLIIEIGKELNQNK